MKIKLFQNFVVIVFMLCVGCNNCNDNLEVYNTPKFKKSKIKNAVAISKPIKTFQLYGLDVLGDYFVVLAPIGNRFVHIYDKHTGEMVSSSVARGRANNELLFVNSFALDKSTGVLTLYDATSKSMLDVTIKESGECVVGTKEIYTLSNLANSVLKLNKDNMFIFSNSPNIDTIPRLSLSNRGEIIDSNYIQPISDKAKSSMTYVQPLLSLSPDRSKIAIATIYGSILETYTIKNDKIKNINTSYFIEPLFDDNTIWGMCSIATSNKYIYSSYNGSSEITKFNKVALFSWSHKPLELWEVEDCDSIASLCVNGSHLYAIADLGDHEYRIVEIK